VLVLVVALLLGLLVGFATGGRLTHLKSIQMRSAWLVPLALAIQLIAFSRLRDTLGADLVVTGHLVSYALLLAFVVRNYRVPGLVLAGIGTGLNALAIMLNGGYMPASREALTTAGVLYGGETSNNSGIADASTRLSFLGDVFAVPQSVPLANVFSVGDVLIAVGVAWLLAHAMRSPREASPSAVPVDSNADPL